MKKFALVLAALLAVSGLADTKTPVLDLNKPSYSSITYGTLTSANFGTIDELLPATRGTVPSGSVAGDAVYVSAPGTWALSNASSAGSDGQVDGFIYRKLTATTAFIMTAGRVPISGLTDGDRYWLSAATSGKVTDVAPSSPDAIIPVGVAVGTGTSVGTVLVIRGSFHEDAASTVYDLQDSYDAGSSVDTVTLDNNGSLEFLDDSSSRILKINETTVSVDIPTLTGTTATITTVNATTGNVSTVNSTTVNADVGAVELVETDELDLIPRSGPLTTTSTPAGAFWFTDGSPSGGFDADTLHYFDGSDWLPVGGSSGSSITGSGTDDHLVRWNGTGDIQDSDLILDDTASNVLTLRTDSNNEFHLEGSGEQGSWLINSGNTGDTIFQLLDGRSPTLGFLSYTKSSGLVLRGPLISRSLQILHGDGSNALDIRNTAGIDIYSTLVPDSTSVSLGGTASPFGSVSVETVNLSNSTSSPSGTSGRITIFNATSNLLSLRHSTGPIIPIENRVFTEANIDDGDSPYTASYGERFIYATTAGGPLTINLPAVSGVAGEEFEIKHLSGSNAITIEPDGSELIDGASNLVGGTSPPYFWRVRANSGGSAWYVQGNY